MSTPTRHERHRSVRALASRLKGRRNLVLWTTVTTVAGAGALGLVLKPDIQTAMRPGQIIRAEFTGNYQLYPNESKVKVNDLDVGVVTSVTPISTGPVVVTMKVDPGTLASLGSAPHADIEPTTVLGGTYTVNLTAGGRPGTYDVRDTIPLSRTSTPVELDQILQALSPSALTGMQNSIKNLDQALANGAGSQLDQFAARAPGVMRSGTQVFGSAQGTRPGTDLQTLVPDVSAISSVLTRNDGQLSDIVANLNATTQALARGSQPLGSAIAAMPQTLASTREGLRRLTGTLDDLTTTAPAFLPAARQLTPVVTRLTPVAAQARPVVRDLVPLLDDADPLVNELIPTARNATSVLNDIRGPVLRRVNGPILHSLDSTWHGTGIYAGDGEGDQANQKFYQEIAYTFAVYDNGSKIFSKNGYTVDFGLGAGATSVETGNTPLGKMPLITRLLQGVGTPSGGK